MQRRPASASVCLCFLSLFLLSLRSFSSYSACTFLLVSQCQASHRLALSRQSSDMPHFVRSLGTRSFHLCFCPPTARLLPTGAQTRSCCGRRLSSIRKRWPRSQSLRCMSTEDSLCCVANLLKLRFMSLTDAPKMILRQRMANICSHWIS